MTDPDFPIADGPDKAVSRLIEDIGPASGGAVVVGFGHGVTSEIPNDLTPAHRMTHRAGTGIDLDLTGLSATYFGHVVTYLQTLDLAELVPMEDTRQIHVTVRPGKILDLTGFPKPPTRKKSTETADDDTPPVSA